MREGFDEEELDRIIAWLDDHVTEGWQIGPVQFVVIVMAFLFLATEIWRWI